jgi:hypothetical protein
MDNFMSSVYWIRQESHTDMFSQGYIGMSNNVKDRFEAHKNRPSNAYLKHAIAKYGWDNLIKQQLIIGDDAYCLAMELKLRPTDKIGWNLVMGGGKPPLAKKGSGKGRVSWNKGIPQTEEVKNKLRIATSLRMKDPAAREISRQGALGRVCSDETRTKLSIVHAGNKYRLGKKASDETKKKMSLARIGFVPSEETRKKISEANKNRICHPMTGKHFPKIECPHCGKIGGLTAMPRWHFDNCKLKAK